jgi:thioredoxin 1
MNYIDSTNYQSFAQGTGLLYFTAEWCGPCKMMKPVFDVLDSEVNIGKVDIDSQQEIAVKNGIRSIPTILFIKNGAVVDRHTGAAPISILRDKIKRNGL